MDRRTAGRPCKGAGLICRNVNKYGNRRTRVFGADFDSKHEAERYMELRSMEKAGKIQGLETQVPFQLLPAQFRDGKCVERAVRYVADFVYWQGPDFVVEDAKSPATRTPEYIIKRKLMLYIHGISIKEV